MTDLLKEFDDLIEKKEIKNTIKSEESENISEESTEQNNIAETQKKIEISDTTINNIPTDVTMQNNDTSPNTLSLTLKKDYSIFVIKNIFIETLKNSCRVALAVILINLLKFFF